MEDLKTTAEVESLSSEIDSLSESLFELNNSFTKSLSKISETFARKITDLISKNNIDIHNTEKMRNFLSEIKIALKKLKIIKIVLAFDPSEKTIDDIHDFVSEHIGIGFILDIEVQKDVLGGAIVIFNGKYNDFTLKKRIEEVFANKNGELLKFI